MQNFMYNIPKDYRICGEYLYAEHSIHYEELETYFMVFSVWNGDFCLSWEDTKKFCEELNLKIVPILYEGVYDTNITKKIAEEVVNRGGEGIVVRVIDSFSYNDFSNSIAKYVRKNHLQTSDNWNFTEIKKNSLK